MGTAKSSVSHTFNSNGHCGDDLARRSTPIRIARGLLGRDCNTHVMQSTLGATLLISVERIAATALGALAGALLANYFTGNLAVFAAAVFVLGLFCAAFRIEKSAYRYASITLAIIVLIPRSNAAWIVALHRFFEVSDQISTRQDFSTRGRTDIWKLC
jgi:F0F1-type ATP synthase assembly protein I